MRNKLFALCLAVWLLLTMSVTAFAQRFDADRVGSISVTLVDQAQKRPVAEAQIAVYHVASVERNSNHRLFYTYTEEFEVCGFDLNDPQLSTKLAAFVEEHAVPAETAVTDARGKAVLDGLPLGLYLVRQTAPAVNGVVCMPFLVTVPNETGSGYEYNVDARPKADVVETTDITVRKVWNVDETVKIADHVTVSLLRDGAVVKTATLTEETGWEVTFYDMPCSDAYSIVEEYVPEGFTATYSQSGYVFTVINSASLIQTGQVIWPIPLLAVSGAFLLAVGGAFLRRSGERDA